MSLWAPFCPSVSPRLNYVRPGCVGLQFVLYESCFGDIPDPLYFHVSLRINLSTATKKFVTILFGIALNQDRFGEN